MNNDTKDTPSETRVFINGNIITMDSHNTIVEAVLVRDGRIVKTGTTEEIKSLIDNQESVIDLEGKTMLPGFIDAHGHFPGSGIFTLGVNINSPPIGEMTNIPQILSALKTKAEGMEKGKWILGWGIDDTLLDEKRMIDRYELDDVSSDHPIYISHISGHIGVANSLALEKAGFNAETPNPAGGIIRKDPNTGIPNGILEEEAAFALTQMALDFTPEESLLMVQSAVEEYARYGVTSAQSGLCDEKFISGIATGFQFGVIPLRVMAWPNIELTDKILKGEFDKDSLTTDLFKIGAAKIIGDGSIQAYTAYLSKPYHVPSGHDSDNCGYPVTSREEMVSLVSRFHKAGLQIAIHGNGDAAIDNIIHAISEAQKEHPRDDARHIIIHCQTVRDDQLDEIKRLGITPSFFSAHAYYWGDRHRNTFLGPERADRLNPAKSAAEKGIRFTIHVDTPVTPMRPLLLAWSAVNRISTGGNIIGESEQISPLQALRSITIDAAWQIFQEDNFGSIEKGKFADMVILSENPLNNPENMRDIAVLETMVAGKTIYKK